ncbi:MAG: LytTR family DNA-binding domain-containing protein [Burkholderiaceae bacterium]|nr:LytTR family DNA-binding domain-containing protein [Burkholderiaceae bacterium]
MSQQISAMIVDDEPPMREQLRARLHEVWPELLISAEAGSGMAAMELARTHAPTIIFLDIRMPGQSGIDAAKTLVQQAHVVFVTAYDEYAVDAFERGAIDYLLKPVDTDRLRICCERLKARIAEEKNQCGNSAVETAQIEQVTSLLNQLSKHAQLNKKEYLRWIQASVGNSLRMISTKEVLFFRADDKYTCVQTEQGEFLIRKTLKELEDELDPKEFWRIHRSNLVRVDAITEVSRDFRGRQLVSVRGHTEKLEVSRNHSHLFQQM